MRKLCPITGHSCKEELCVWWREYADQCAIPLIVGALTVIVDAIEEVSKNER